MSQHHGAQSHTHLHEHDDFSTRFRKNLRSELRLALTNLWAIFRICMALLVGIILFLSEFNFVRIVLALVFPVLFVLIVGMQFTLLPTYLIVIITIVSIASISLSDKGENLIEWFSDIAHSLFLESSGSSSPSPAYKKVMGFVGISAIASLFLVFLI